MAYMGTREGSSWWKRTSAKKLVSAEKQAWKVAAKGLDYLESYYVPIEFNQKYPKYCRSMETNYDWDESTRLISKRTEDPESQNIFNNDQYSTN